MFCNIGNWFLLDVWQITILIIWYVILFMKSREKLAKVVEIYYNIIVETG